MESFYHLFASFINKTNVELESVEYDYSNNINFFFNNSGKNKNNNGIKKEENGKKEKFEDHTSKNDKKLNKKKDADGKSKLNKIAANKLVISCVLIF